MPIENAEASTPTLSLSTYIAFNAHHPRLSLSLQESKRHITLII